MRTSARNEFVGLVKGIRKGVVNTEVVLDIGDGLSLAAVVTNESVDHLGLALGVEACALIKAPWVIVTAADGALRTSARNTLCGTVVRCHKGVVNCEIVIELESGKTIAAVMTKESLENLGLEEGMGACALIKASHIILAVTG
ncbi:MAG: TOBE domain-containing protein [Acidiferrobacter sp.]